jgi:hypothetical protein
MRLGSMGSWIAEAGDTRDLIFNHWGGFTPHKVLISDEASPQWGFGGIVLDEYGMAHSFDGFVCRADARTFATEVLGVPADRIREVVG